MAVDVASPSEAPEPRPISTRRGRHPVQAFLLRRLVAGLAILLVASAVIFFATNVLPGNVASVVLGKSSTPAAMHTLRVQLHLNRPVTARYVSWLGGVVQGDLGQSAVQLAQGAQRAPVVTEIGTPFLNSAILAGVTVIVLVPLALLLGTVAGVSAGRARDFGISYVTLVLGAFPEFVLGTFLVLVLFTELHLLPPVSGLAPGQTPGSRPDILVLPVLTLLGVSMGFATRQIRAGVVEVMRQDYVTVAQLNGLGRRRVLWRYALRNALAPSVQVFAQTIQYLVGGIIVVESVFDYPGIGQFLVNAVQTRDVTAVESVAVILAAIYVLINILADLLVVFLIPKLWTTL